jgi:hypothetical protein
MCFGASRSKEMDDLVAACPEKLGHKATVALLPWGLRTHEARPGLEEGRCKRLLPAGGGHSRDVTSKGANPNAAEALLAGFARSAAAEFDGVPITDPFRAKGRFDDGLIELRVATRAGVPPDIDERLHSCLEERRHEFVGRTRAVSDRPDAHEVTLFAFYGTGLGYTCAGSNQGGKTWVRSEIS